MFIIEYYDVEFNTTTVDDLYFTTYEQAVEYLTVYGYVLEENSNKIIFTNFSIMENAEIKELTKFETENE